MLIHPTPQLLIHHSDSQYSNQIMRREQGGFTLDDMKRPKEAFVYLDLGFMCLNGINPRIRKSQSQTATLFSAFLDVLNPEIPLFLGVLACSANDPQTAIKFYKLAAQRGSASAMNALGLLYQKHSSLTLDSQSAFDESFKWFSRAKKCLSLDAFKYLGDLFRHNKKPVNALDCYFKHYQQTKSIYSAKCCAELLQELNFEEIALKMNRICVASGESDSVLSIIELSNQCPGLAEVRVWKELAERYNITKPVDFAFSDYLSAIKDEGTTLPPFAAAANILTVNDPFGSLKNTQKLLQKVDSVSYPTVTPPSSISPDSSWKPSQIAFFPSHTPTRLLQLAFSFASARFEERNLNLCMLALNACLNAEPKGIYSSQLWQHRLAHPRLEDYAPLGFISFLVQSTNAALKLFEAGARRGCVTCALMAGILNFHGLGTDENKERGLFFLVSCGDDPLALLYTGLTNKRWTKRACRLLGLKRAAACEWAGDCFRQGVKIPAVPAIAVRWLSKAFYEAEYADEDLHRIAEKMFEMPR